MTASPTDASYEDRFRLLADRAAMAAFFLWAAMRATVRLSGSDYWWHLGVGRYIWEERTLPKTDIFTFSAGDTPWVNVSWLADLGMFGVHQLGGIPALGALLTALVLLALCAVALTGYHRYHSAVLIPLAMLVVLLHESRFVLRPFLLSSTLTALTVFIIERHRADGQRSLWWLVPLVWLWSCIHGAFPFLFALLGVYGFEVLLQRKRYGADTERHFTGWRREFLSVTIVLAACVVVTVLQPYGLDAYSRINEMLSSRTWHAMIGEWQPMTRHAAEDPALGLQWYGFLLLVSLSFVCNLRRMSLFRLCAFLGPLLLAFSANRHLDVFLYTAAPIAALNFHEFLAARKSGGLRQSRMLAAAWALVMCFTAGIAIHRNLTQHYLIDGRDERVHTWDVAPFEYPEEPFRHLQRHPVTGRTFNTFEHGGYLFWHGYPETVFIDSKGLDEQQFLRYMNALGSPMAFEASTQRWDLRAVVATLDRSSVLLYKQLLDSPSWQLELFDATGFVFTRRVAPRPDLAMPNPAPPRERPHVPAHVVSDPNAPLPLAEMTEARFWRLAREPKIALTALVKAVKVSGATQPRLQLARLYLEMNDPGSALTLLGSPYDSKSIEARALRAEAHLLLGQIDAAELAAPTTRIPNEDVYSIRTEIALVKQDAAKALDIARHWSRVFRRSSPAQQALARAQALGGDPQNALKAAGHAVELAPYDPKAYTVLGTILENLGNSDAAKDAFLRAAHYERTAHHIRKDL